MKLKPLLDLLLALSYQVKRGDNVTLRHAEVLQHSGIVANPQHGMIYTDNLRSARATDTYIFGGRRSLEEQQSLFKSYNSYQKL